DPGAVTGQNPVLGPRRLESQDAGGFHQLGPLREDHLRVVGLLEGVEQAALGERGKLRLRADLHLERRQHLRLQNAGRGVGRVAQRLSSSVPMGSYGTSESAKCAAMTRQKSTLTDGSIFVATAVMSARRSRNF